MYISGAKFEEHCSNITGDILYLVFYRWTNEVELFIMSSLSSFT